MVPESSSPDVCTLTGKARTAAETCNGRLRGAHCAFCRPFAPVVVEGASEMTTQGNSTLGRGIATVAAVALFGFVGVSDARAQAACTATPVTAGLRFPMGIVQTNQ